MKKEQAPVGGVKGVRVELSFVIAAVRRRAWLVVLLILLGFGAGFGATASRSVQYEATAVLSIQPSSSAAGVTSSSDPDRFIAGEVVAMKGSSIADAVIKTVPGTNRVMLANAVRAEQKAKTDVVNIMVKLPDAQLAQAVANAYATTYIAEATQRDSQGYGAEVAEIESQLADLSQKINGVETERAKITPNSTNVADRTRDSQLFEQTSSYRALYTQLLAQETTLRYSSKLKLRSEVVQLAPLPVAPAATSRSLYVAAGAFLGAVFGLVAAVAWANSSRRLLDVVQLEEIVGAKSVGTLPRAKVLASEPKTAFENLPDKTASVIDQLCVRSEASAQGDTDALTIAVVGSRRGAGATTVALAMAGRFARNGARTVVIDGDLANPTISRSFHALDDAGIPGLLARLAAARREPLAPGAPAPVPPESLPARVFTPTTLADVRVLGTGAPSKARSLHRTNVDTVIDASARGGVDVVIVDGGPLLDAATSVRLCQVVDVVVLVVPVKRQQIEPLGVINRLLGYRSGDLLPVATKLKPKDSARPKASPSNDSSDVDDIIEAATRWGSGEHRERRPASSEREEWDAKNQRVTARANVANRALTPTGRGYAGRSTGSMPASPRLGAPPLPRLGREPSAPIADEPWPSDNGATTIWSAEPQAVAPLVDDDAAWVARENDANDEAATGGE